MNKTLVWTIIAIIVVVGIILLVSMGKNDNTNTDNSGETNLPDTNQVQYNALATSTDDFSALDDATNQLG